jgi:hypothetical protein
MPVGAYATTIEGITVSGSGFGAVSAVDDASAVYKGADKYTSSGSGAVIWGGSAMSAGTDSQQGLDVEVFSAIDAKYSIIGGATVTSGGSASGNTVTVYSAGTNSVGHASGAYVIGGAALSGGSAYSNKVLVSGDNGVTVEGTVIGGAVVGAGNAYSNIVSAVNSGIVSGSVIGGEAETGDAYANSVFVNTSAFVGKNVIGGATTTGNASSNVVSIDTSAVVSGNVYGGYTLSGNATSNTASINNSAVVSGVVYGGFTSAGNADNNSVSIAGSAQISKDAYGGYTSGGNVTGNTVVVTGADTLVEGLVAGGYTVSGTATSNTASLNSGATASSNVYGGYAVTGNADYNSANVGSSTTSAIVSGAVYGGYASAGSATGNLVNVAGENTVVEGLVAGGYVVTSGATSANTVNIGTSAVVSGAVYGGYAVTGNATGNSVNIGTSAVTSGNVYGGFTSAGNADNNSVSIAGSAQITDNKNVYGGFTSGGDVTGNTVVVTGAGTLVEGLVAGGYTVSGTATSNTASLNSGATVSGSVYGGYASAGNATGNSANVGASATSAIVSGAVYGGYVANSGSATGNVVNVAGNGTVVSGVIAGGYVVASGAASDNTVNIGTSAVTSGNVYGGFTSAGDASNNSVSIAGSAQIDNDKSVYGGFTSGGNVTGNAVVVTGAGTLVEGLVAGGYTISGAATSNTVSIDNSAIVSGAAYGGFTSAGNVTGNKVTIDTSATVSGAVYGGYTSAGNATGNVVTINGGKIVGDIFGGEANGSGNVATSNGVGFGSGNFAVANVYGGANSNTSAGDFFTGNTLTLGTGANVSAGQVDNFAMISFGTGSTSLANSTGSSVVLGNDSALTEITVTAGGTASLANAALTGTGFKKTGDGTLNLGSATNSHSTNIIAGGTLAISKVSALGSATSNVLSGGTLSLATSGNGYTPSWNIGAGTSNVITASNDVSIGSSGGSAAIQFASAGGAVVFAGGHRIDVYGGIKNYTGGEVYVSGTSTVVGLMDSTNSVISADSRYSFTKMTVGGNTTLVLDGGVVLTTNKLVLDEDSTISGGNSAVYNVQPKDDEDEQPDGVVVPDVIVNGGVTISGLTSSGETFTFNITSAAIAFSGSQSGDDKFLSLGSGVKLVLDEVTFDYTSYDGDASKTFDATKVEGLEKIYSQKGFLTEYYWKKDDSTQYVRATEQAKALSEGFLGGIGLLTLGGDLVTGQGIASAARGVARSGGAGQSFAALGGGKLKYKTGSHVDVSGTALVAGLAAGVGNGATVGGFVEYGDGDYDSHNSFSRGKVKGSGDAEYIGIGILGRFELPRNASGQPYLEATARFGRVESDFSTRNFLLVNGDVGPRAKYDIKSSYHGLSFGGGHVWNVGTNSAFDLYGRYVWTHQAGDSVTLSGYGEDVKFSAVDSHRLRFGGRYSSKLGNTNSFYAGAAWEHEFDGEANAKVVGAGKIDAPEMKGSTGLAEFGFVFVPADNKNLSIDLGLQVYGGKRSGATGGAKLKYEF